MGDGFECRPQILLGVVSMREADFEGRIRRAFIYIIRLGGADFGRLRLSGRGRGEMCHIRQIQP